MNSKIVFWDWNGTLLDDIDACVGAMNEMLSKRKMSAIDSSYYKSVFGFPVRDYYKELGFNLEQERFEELSVEFISGYNKRSNTFELHISAIEALKFFQTRGIRQVIISAMEQKMLENLLDEFGIRGYFHQVKGLKDIYAVGKTHLAQEYLVECNVSPSEILFIGDTLHDAEVAEEIGSQLILVSNGHHSYERLRSGNYKIVPDLSSLLGILN